LRRFPPEFQDWYHNKGGKDRLAGEPDPTYEELKELENEWIELGRPMIQSPNFLMKMKFMMSVPMVLIESQFTRRNAEQGWRDLNNAGKALIKAEMRLAPFLFRTPVFVP